VQLHLNPNLRKSSFEIESLKESYEKHITLYVGEFGKV